MTPHIVTVGWLTIDDIVLTDHQCRPAMLGGGALYSAVGARLWCERVGIHSVIGQPSLDSAASRIHAWGLDTGGITAIDGNGLLVWLLHETDTDKQQVPKLNASTPAEMEAGRGPLPVGYRSARGFHVAPQSPAGSLANLARLLALPGEAIVTLDVLADTFIDRSLYGDLGFLKGVTAFLPSEAEIARIWAPVDPAVWLCTQAAAHRCHMGMKLGGLGSMVCDAATTRLYRVPAFPAAVIDTTGAGDAYCGGFLAGLVAGRPVPECAAMGTVSASFVVEACGALRTVMPQPAERDSRLRTVLAKIENLTP